MTRLPFRFPAPLAGRLSAFTAAVFNAQGRNLDVALGGVPFRLATNGDFPLLVVSEQMNKEQVDQEREPGEQSLSGWWRRSQDSFHEGAGALYQESRDQVTASSRFNDSSNIDVWAVGELKLLRRPVQSAVTGTLHHASLWLSSADNVGVAMARSNEFITIPTLESTTVTTQRNMGKTVADGLVTGSRFLALATDGTLEEGAADGLGVVAGTWTMTSIGTATRMKFGMHRLWVIGGRHIYQPDLATPGATAALFTHPSQGWAYTDIADGPSSMYFSGHDNRVSSIQMITSQEDGGIPALSGARVACILPEGELVQKIEVLAGQFIGIGTNQGFRMGALDPSDGSITYGPLFLAPENVLECTALCTMGRWFVVTFRCTGGTALTYRVDTSLEVADGEFAYAPDTEFQTSGWMTSLAAHGERILGTHSGGTYNYQHATELCETGFLQTGRIRFRTTEKKVFRFLELEIQPLQGLIQVDGFEETGTEFDIFTYSTQNEIALEEVRFPDALGGQTQIALKFTLSRSGSDATKGPVLNSYLVRALPAVKPRRIYQLPLLCFDFEQDRFGNVYGQDGLARDRLQAVMALEDSGEFVNFEDFTILRQEGRQVQIDETRFLQTSPPAGAEGWGGVLQVTLKTVD